MSGRPIAVAAIPAAMERTMSEPNPTEHQIAVLDHVSRKQREFEQMLLDLGLTYAASRLAQFEDPTFDNQPE